MDRHHSSTRATRENENTKDRRQSGDGGKFASLQRWLKGDDVKKPDRPPVPPPPKYDPCSIINYVSGLKCSHKLKSSNFFFFFLTELTCHLSW